MWKNPKAQKTPVLCRCFRPKVVVPESRHHGQPDVPADFDKFVFRHWPFSNTVCLLGKNTCYGIFRCNFWLSFQRLCYFVVRYCSKSSRHRYRKMKMITDYAAMHLFTMARRNGRTSVYCCRSFLKRFETLLAEMPRQHLFFVPFSPGPRLSNYGILCFTV